MLRRVVLGCLLVAAAISLVSLNAVAGLVFVLSVLICPCALAILLNRVQLRDDWVGDYRPPYPS